MQSTKDQIIEDVLSAHRLLTVQDVDTEALPVATLLFVSASLGSYDSQRLVPVGIGLELLRAAVGMHYRYEPSNPYERNLKLVTSDFFYAEAIRRVGMLNISDAVVYMVRAIMDISQAEATLSKVEHPSLYYAAVNLGMLLAECSEDSREDLLLVAGALAGNDKTKYMDAISRLPKAQSSILKDLI